MSSQVRCAHRSQMLPRAAMSAVAIAPIRGMLGAETAERKWARFALLGGRQC
jgi:hypothetical protein